MIGVDVRSNISDVLAEFRVLKKNVSEKATVRALNRALDQSATEANRQIRSVYNVRAQAVAAAMKKRRAYAGAGTAGAVLEIRGVRLGLIEFAARQTRGGVTVQIKRGSTRQLFRGTFITTLASGANSGYRGVFQREGKARYPIKALRSISVPTAFRNEAVLKAVRQVALESFQKNFRQQLRFLSGD